MMPLFPRPEHEDDRPEQEESREEEQHGQAGEEMQESPDVAPGPASQLPPEARGETNGGPLGCCFGVSMGLLVSVGLASLSIPVIGNLDTSLNGFLAFLVNAVAVVFVIVVTIALGVAGWRIGRRVFREYQPSPRQLKLAQQEQRQLRQTRGK